jgi:hypothetical protein
MKTVLSSLHRALRAPATTRQDADLKDDVRLIALTVVSVFALVGTALALPPAWLNGIDAPAAVAELRDASSAQDSISFSNMDLDYSLVPIAEMQPSTHDAPTPKG